eukprot:m.40611 g.40611  ORF g.40611 m.40611 type:complete len:63 (+) comp32985_c0_seq1:118-306(+)
MITLLVSTHHRNNRLGIFLLVPKFLLNLLLETPSTFVKQLQCFLLRNCSSSINKTEAQVHLL